jgi:CRISPR-associated protein Cmr4
MTPLHVGSGSDLGVVDMPIQRESHTGFPKIEASSLKGSIRKEFEDDLKSHIVFGYDKDRSSEEINQVFGDEKNRDFSGALGFTDSKILFFPIKSVKGVFAWVTSVLVIDKLIQDLSIKDNDFNEIQKVEKNTISNKKDSKLIVKDNIIILEEYSFEVQENTNTKKLADFLSSKLEIVNLSDKLVVLDDDDFTHFVKNSTEVITRTKIDNITGTVQNGALFTEEYLPSETVMYSLAIANKPFSDKSDLKSAKNVMDYFNNISKVIQIGGNSTLGKGIVEISCEGCGNE